MQKSNAGFHERYAEVFRQSQHQGAGDQLDVVDDPEGVLGVVMVGQFDEIGRSLYQTQLSQRGVCHRSDFGGIRIDDLQVFCKDLRGACSLGAGGVIVNVAPLKLSGESRWCGVGMEGQMEIVVSSVG